MFCSGRDGYPRLELRLWLSIEISLSRQTSTILFHWCRREVQCGGRRQLVWRVRQLSNGAADTRNKHLWPRKMDAVLLEGVANALKQLAAYEIYLAPGLRHDLEADHHAGGLHSPDALALDRLEQRMAELRVRFELFADLLHELLHLSQISVEGEQELELQDEPVAALVGQLLDLAERHCVQRPSMMAQFEGTDRNALDRSAGIADYDVLPDAEGVLRKEEDT